MSICTQKFNHCTRSLVTFSRTKQSNSSFWVRHHSLSTSQNVLLFSNSPPSLPPSSDSEHAHISDQEWEMRTGRAIYVLQQTLPQFFSTGLLSSVEPPSPLSATSIFRNGDTSRGNNGEKNSIYSPRIRLSYTPPVAVPAPLPRTLHLEGLPLYTASSTFVRHTLNALYTDLHVDLRRFVLHSPSHPRSQPQSLSPSITREIRRERDKSLQVGFIVSGVARVSGSTAEWDIDSTYTFSPHTGLIATHVIDSIHPAPHTTVYDALRAALAKLGFGLAGEVAAPEHARLHLHAGEEGERTPDRQR